MKVRITIICLGLAFSTQTAAQAAMLYTTTVSSQTEAVWELGPFPIANQTGCLGSGDPTCGHTALSVNASHGASVLVAVTSDDGASDFDLFVFYPDGGPAASSTTSGKKEAVVFQHRTDRGAGAYEVRVQPVVILPGAVSTLIALVPEPADEDEVVCTDPPDFVRSDLDIGETLQVSVLVLHDGVTQERAQAVMTKAAETYQGSLVSAPNISFLLSYREVAFVGTEAAGLIREAKNYVDANAMMDFDVVYVLSSEQFVGHADCLGGVRNRNRAYAAGPDQDMRSSLLGLSLGPGRVRQIRSPAMGGYRCPTIGSNLFDMCKDISAKIAAHEIGHLFGADHNMSNCTEGATLEELSTSEVSPCTVMLASPLSSLRFSTLSKLVVRAHAWRYLRD